MAELTHYSKGHKELCIRLNPVFYIVMHCNLKSWALPLKIQKFVWSSNKNPEWFVDFLCFHFCINNYGILVRDKDWPKDWKP